MNETQETDFSWDFVWSLLLGFVLVVSLGLCGGGYDLLVGGQAGIVIWWVLLLAVAVGALPRRAPGPVALAALGLLAAFATWTALSLGWTESTEKTTADLAMTATLLGAFSLAILSRHRRGVEEMVLAVGAGIVVVATVALLARFHPAWFPAAAETGRFLTTGRERLSYPLDYWNGLAALLGIGLPLVLHVACEARRLAIQVLAAAALPALVLALFLTLSRGGIAAALIAVATYLVLAGDRLPRLLTLSVSALGGGVLIFLVTSRNELEHGFAGDVARSQGDEMVFLTTAVCVLAGLAQTAIVAYGRRPDWAHVSRRQAGAASATAAAVLLVAFLAVGGPGRVSDAWSDFKEPSEGTYAGTSRLTAVGGENRYQLWSSAVREFDSSPLEGTGANTFQLWWTRDADVAGAPTLDTHSLYLQTLGELGLVGLALLLAFVALSLYYGIARTLRASPARRGALAAALAGSTPIWTSSLVDWTWKIPVIPIAALLLIAVVVTAGDAGAEHSGMRWPLRVGVVAVSLAALAAIAIPLAGTSLLRDSQAAARAGDAEAALADARSAQNVQPGAASPRMQEALILESEGELEEAALAARQATQREPTNWRTWLLLARIEAQRGRPGAALADYRRARSLNPLSPIFNR